MEAALKVHADVLKLARTDAHRDLILWLHGRRLFFEPNSHVEGFCVAQQCNHADARHLVSLFPGDGPKTREEALVVFLARQDDARCQCWAAVLLGPGAMGERKLFRMSAEAGYAWGIARNAKRRSEHKLLVEALELAASLGEPEAMVLLSNHFSSCAQCNMRARSSQLLLEAAHLGDPVAQFDCPEKCFARNSLEQFVWLRRSALQTQTRKGALSFLSWGLDKQLQRYEEGASGRILFEIGMTFDMTDGWVGAWGESVMKCNRRERVEKLFKKWLQEARQAIMCWMWAKMLGVSKDIRQLIADLVWDDRAAWSERPQPNGCISFVD